MERKRCPLNNLPSWLLAFDWTGRRESKTRVRYSNPFPRKHRITGGRPPTPYYFACPWKQRPGDRQRYLARTTMTLQGRQRLMVRARRSRTRRVVLVPPLTRRPRADTSSSLSSSSRKRHTGVPDLRPARLCCGRRSTSPELVYAPGSIKSGAPSGHGMASTRTDNGGEHRSQHAYALRFALATARGRVLSSGRVHGGDALAGFVCRRST
ncbi:hypothetical protein B0H12DRAFT_428103 [Mycena haematopus]|nr:hypothetical protein B0H12DRAFT_428103 [Mycena haematopus]